MTGPIRTGWRQGATVRQCRIEPKTLGEDAQIAEDRPRQWSYCANIPRADVLAELSSKDFDDSFCGVTVPKRGNLRLLAFTGQDTHGTSDDP